MVGASGHAYGIERWEELAEKSVSNTKRDGKGAWLDSGRLHLAHGDGSVGANQSGPFDAIHVGPLFGIDIKRSELHQNLSCM